MNLNLQNRRILVTGASGDIGSSISRTLAHGGAHVALHYNSSLSLAKSLASEPCFAANGSTLLQADLTSEAQTRRLFEDLSAQGVVHDLVCNAGFLTEEPVALAEMSLEQWTRSIERNLTATFLTLRGFLHQLKGSGVTNPSIVIVGSMSGVWGQPGHTDYSASKAAMVSGLLPSLKDEIVQIAPLGRVNLVAPGFIRTRMIKNKLADRETMLKVLQTASLRKFGTPEDVANAVGFLTSSSLSGHITGEVMRLAGGKEGRVLFETDDIDF